MRGSSIKKPAFLILALVFSGLCLRAQSPSYNQLISIISAKAPDLATADKIIAFSCWSSSNLQSRETNKELNRVGIIYQGAKLRNGVKGALVISCNMDDAATAAIVANKDGITYAIKINKSDFSFLANCQVNTNVVYDATGTAIHQNLEEKDVFLSFNHLIIR